MKFLSSSSEFWVMFLAAVGGGVVFLGLFLERIAEWKSEKNIVKPRKALSDWGWRILMVGIVIEIGDASWTAYEINKNDPHNIPIKTLSAYAMLEVRPLEQVDFSGLKEIIGSKNLRIRLKSGDQQAAWLELGRSKELSLTNIEQWGRTELPSDNVSTTLETDPQRNNEKLLRFDLYFGERGFLNVDSLTANDVDAIALLLPIHCEIVRGKVEMTINSSLEKTFLIPQQTNFFKMATSIDRQNKFAPYDFHWKPGQKMYFK